MEHFDKLPKELQELILDRPDLFIEETKRSSGTAVCVKKRTPTPMPKKKRGRKPKKKSV